MERYIIHPHRWTRMQDAGLARSETLSTAELARREHVEAPDTPDLVALGHFLAHLTGEFATAWAAARKRRQTLKALKRLDRRLLADMGMDRARLREVVDAMVDRQEPAPRAGDRSPGPRIMEGSWMDSRPAA